MEPSFEQQRSDHQQQRKHANDDAETREVEEDKRDMEEVAQAIKYTYLGSEDCPITSDAEEIEFSMNYRIPKIEGLQHCFELRVSPNYNAETWFAQKPD